MLKRISCLILICIASHALLADERSTFDVIVVGVGSSGSAFIGEILSKSTDLTVLALEAGDLPDDARILDPNKSLELWGSNFSFKDYSVPQIGLGGREFLYTAGRGGGGSSLLNGTVWVHGRAEDYNQWRDAGNAGWGGDDVLQVVRELENYVDRPSPQRGRSGPISVHGMNSLSPFSIDFVRALVDFGVPYAADYNMPGSEGVSFVQQNINLDGQRLHAFNVFVAPHLKDPRLTLVPHARVAKVIINGDHRASGVQWMDREGGLQTAEARQYVVLSAGTFRTPQILMLSGIGSSAELAKLQIDVVHELKGVGENLHDHPACIVAREVKLTYPLKRTMQNIGFFGKTAQGTPRFKMQTYHIRQYPPYDPNSFGIGVELQHPYSRGNVRLRSSNIEEAPSIDPNVLSDPRDLEELVEGLKQADSWLSYFRSNSNWFGEKRLPRQKSPTVEEWRDFARQHTFPDFHPVGTSKMGPTTDPMAVVDSRLDVHGIRGLKVIDASIMPSVPSGNIYATTLASV